MTLLKTSDGVLIAGVDPDDDGSGSNTDGGQGFGGGGRVVLKVEIDSTPMHGYVEPVGADVGGTVTGSNGASGVLLSYDTVSYEWVIKPNSYADMLLFVDGVTLACADTGAGDILSYSRTYIQGGLLSGTGLAGNAAEGQYTLNNPSQIGSGDASAWRGSGSGINIVGWTYTSELDGQGFADIQLLVVDGWNTVLNGFQGLEVTLTELDVVVFRGYVTDVRLQGQYQGSVTVQEKHSVLQEREVMQDFAQIISDDGDLDTDTISVLDDDTVTLTNGDVDGLADDGTMAVMIVPGEELSSSNEDFDTLDTGTGDIDDVNTDDGANVGANLISGATATELVMSGTYSGTRGDVTALTLQTKCKAYVPFLFVMYDIVMYLYNYITSEYDEVDRVSISGSLPIFTTPVEFRADLVAADSPQNYIKAADNEFKVRIYYQGLFSCSFADLVAYTDPRYDGAFFPITRAESASMDSSVSFEDAGVNVGDTVVVGLRADLAIAALMDEHYENLAYSITGFTSHFTAAKFGTENYRTMDALISIVRLVGGFMFYKASDNTLYFVEDEANLPYTGLGLEDGTDPTGSDGFDPDTLVWEPYGDILDDLDVEDGDPPPNIQIDLNFDELYDLVGDDSEVKVLEITYTIWTIVEEGADMYDEYTLELYVEFHDGGTTFDTRIYQVEQEVEFSQLDGKPVSSDMELELTAYVVPGPGGFPTGDMEFGTVGTHALWSQAGDGCWFNEVRFGEQDYGESGDVLVVVEGFRVVF